MSATAAAGTGGALTDTSVDAETTGADPKAGAETTRYDHPTTRVTKPALNERTSAD